MTAGEFYLYEEGMMGIISRIFRARDKPENKTAGSSYAFFMGGSTSGKSVTERSAMQMTAVRLRENTVGGDSGTSAPSVSL